MAFAWPLPSTAGITPIAGHNAAGEPTYGTPFTAPCRFQRTTRFVRLSESETIATDALLFLEADVDIDQEYSIVVGDYRGTVVEVQPQEDIDGNQSHLEVLTRTK